MTERIFGMSGFSRFAIDAHDRFRNGAKPPAIGEKSVDPDRFAPGRVIVAAVAVGTALLHDDPGVNREDAAPAHGARRENPDQGLRMVGCLGSSPALERSAVCQFSRRSPSR